MNQFDFSGNDSTRGVRFLTRMVQFVAQAMLLVFAVQTTEVSGQEAGDLIEVEIPDAAVTIRFHYCPRTPEPVITGDPGKPDQPPFKTTGFYLSEAEITRDQYAAVLGEEKLEEVGNRLEELYLARDNKKGFEGSSYKTFQEGTHPIFCIATRNLKPQFLIQLRLLHFLLGALRPEALVRLLPTYAERRHLLARDPLACVNGFRTLCRLVLRFLFGVRGHRRLRSGHRRCHR